MPTLYSLCSSSKGNCSFVGDKNGGILVDAGVSFAKIKTLLGEREIPFTAIQAVFITHEHSDHIAGLSTLSKNLAVPVYATGGTLKEIEKKNAVCPQTDLREIEHSPAECCGLSVSPFRTPHDSACACGYKITALSGKSACICTDLGKMTPTVYHELCGSEAVLIEANYDGQMLKNGSYPRFLKERIASDFGHLSNTASAAAVLDLFNDGTCHFMLGHLSEQNNFPHIALGCVQSALSNCGATAESDYTLSIAAGHSISF